MKLKVRPRIGILLAGMAAGLVGLLGALALFAPPTAQAMPGYNLDCTMCHSTSSSISVSTDITSPMTVTPGSSFSVKVTWSSGSSYTEVTWPNVKDNAKFVATTPLIVYSGTNKTGTGTSTLTAPSATGTYTIRVYASSSGITNFQDMTIIVASAPTTYSIVASAGSNGSISPSGTVTVNSGASQTFAITPNSGYHVASITVDGQSVAAANTYTFTSVVANHTISASFAVNAYTITASAGANGSISPSGAVTVNSGSNQTFAITANNGYRVASVTVDGKAAAIGTTYTFSNVVANHTISATFAINTYTITASAGANGSISPSGAVSVNSGANQSFAITPSNGYHVISVTVDGQSVATANTYTFTNVVANHTISASFAVNTYTITASAGANGSISPSGAVTVNSGASQSFTITASNGYHVASITVDGQSVATANTYTFTNVVANHTISASFAVNAPTTYTITASAGANGSISPSGAVTVNSGASQSFTITANNGYHVADVLVDGSSVGAVSSYNFANVTAAHTIAATFAVDEPVPPTSYIINASVGASGSIDPSGDVNVSSGADQSFIITADSGYHVDDVLVDGSSVGAVTSYTFTNVTAAHTIAATFVVDEPVPPTTYIINASVGANGSIDPSGDVNVTSGADQSFIITADSGYHVDDVLVDGSSVGAVASYSFTNVTATHTISATFSVDVPPPAPETYVISASAGPNGNISPSGDVTVQAGSDETFVITPDSGYHVDSIVVDDTTSYSASGSSTPAPTSYTFANVSGAHAISVSFALNAVALDSIGPSTDRVTVDSKMNWKLDVSSSDASSLTVTAMIDDVSTGDSNVKGAEYFIDVVGPDGTGTAMSAADASFDSAIEQVTANIDLGNLDSGRHIIYVHGQDTAGNWGPISRVNFQVKDASSKGKPGNKDSEGDDAEYDGREENDLDDDLFLNEIEGNLKQTRDEE